MIYHRDLPKVATNLEPFTKEGFEEREKLVFGYISCCNSWDIDLKTKLKFTFYYHFGHFCIILIWHTRLWENLTKCKSKYHTKFRCPRSCNVWDINPWTKVKFTFFPTLSISTPFLSQTPYFGKILLNVCQSVIQNLDALGLVMCEISIHEGQIHIFSDFEHFNTILISDTILWENGVKCKSKCHTKFGCPSSWNLWNINLRTKVKSRLFSDFEHFNTIYISDTRLWEKMAKCNSKCTAKFRWPSSSNLWNINSRTKVKFRFFSDFEHFNTIFSSDTRPWENVAKCMSKHHTKFEFSIWCSLGDISPLIRVKFIKV